MAGERERREAKKDLEKIVMQQWDIQITATFSFLFFSLFSFELNRYENVFYVLFNYFNVFFLS